MHPAPPSPEHLANQRERIDALRRAIPAALAGRTTFTLEVGSGHGHFLAGYAGAHPERLCVGIDLLLDRHQRAERKRDRAALANLLFFRADAADFLAALPADARFDDVFVLFPDPWPKRRHHKNRLIQPGFLSAVAARACPHVRLHFRTDDPQYFAAAKAIVAAHPDWQLDAHAAWPFELPTVFQQRASSYQSWIAKRHSSTGRRA